MIVLSFCQNGTSFLEITRDLPNRYFHELFHMNYLRDEYIAKKKAEEEANENKKAQGDKPQATSLKRIENLANRLNIEASGEGI